MRCPCCGHELKSSERFCSNCGENKTLCKIGLGLFLGWILIYVIVATS